MTNRVDPQQLPFSVTCYVDSTVALPLLTAYALQRRQPRESKRLMERMPELMKVLEATYAEKKGDRRPE